MNLIKRININIVKILQSDFEVFEIVTQNFYIILQFCKCINETSI